MKMRGLYLEDGTIAFRSDLPLPQPGAGEALLRVSLAGICNTDLELLRGYYPFRGVPGHEFVGVVVDCDSSDWLNQRVVAEINIGCGVCDMCRRGMPTHCRQRAALGIHGRDGALAEYVVAPLANLHVAPAGVSDRAAVFTEPLAAALEVTRQVHVRPDDTVVVLGDGKLGLLVAQAVALSACRLIAIGRHPEKLAILARRGIETRQDSASVAATVDVAVEADVVIECTGSPAGLSEALKLVRPRGVVVLKSTYAGAPQVNMSQIVVDEIEIIGSRCGPFEPALRLLDQGLVDVEPLIDSTFSLEEGVAGFGRAAERGVLKVLVRP
jgi:threonine dehydrogenase-like Zn-dependent dehydrogenase